MFKKNDYTLSQLLELDFNTVIWIAAPVMFALVGLEWFISFKKNIKSYDTKDFFASLGVGLGNLGVNALQKVGLYTIILFFYNLVPWGIPSTWWSFVLCLVMLDFFRYWSHRLAHEHRILWSTHVVHHSSEKYNFGVAFRLSWIQNIKLIFFIPVIMMGFHPVIFFIAHQIEVLYQFWIHTEFIKKLPKPIEFIFTTPSHHRVHHSSNPKYIDKNYGSTFIIWDRIFGTFQKEEENPVYGITKPVNSYNPVYLVFHEVLDLIKDVWKVRKQPLKVFKVLVYSPVNQDERI
jgi:sterol desaturase/sphingolipid hydroxylase (fatty acid hydroxylase superfamily)